MDYGKYIIVEFGLIEHVIMFDSLISHADFSNTFNTDLIKSAGFFQASVDVVDGLIDVCVFGKSITLKLEVRKGIDERLICKVLGRQYM